MRTGWSDDDSDGFSAARYQADLQVVVVVGVIIITVLLKAYLPAPAPSRGSLTRPAITPEYRDVLPAANVGQEAWLPTRLARGRVGAVAGDA